MSLILTFFIPHTRSVKINAFTDPAQYDVEINTARGFKFPTPSKSKSKKIKVDPAQFDVEENVERHITNW